MLLLELASQGLHGFAPTSRAPLKPGYNILVPPGGMTPNLVPLLTALFYNDGRGTDAALGTGQTAAKAGLTLQGRDGRVYRIIRTLGGAGALHRYEPTKTWSVVTQDALEMTQFLRTALGLPSRNQFEGLFCLSPATLPSRRPPEARPSAALAAEPAAGPGRPPTAGPARSIRPNALVEAAMAATQKQFDPSQAQHRIEELRAEVEQGKVLEEQQFKLEGLNQRIFQLEERLKQLDALVESVNGSKEAMRTGHSIESLGLPADALERAKRYDEALKKLNDSVKGLSEENWQREDTLAYSKPQPLWLNRPFQVGAGLGVATMGLGAAFGGTTLGYLGLLDIPAFGFAALTALKWIGDLQNFDSLGRKQALNKEREQKLQQAFDNEFFTIKAAMRILGTDNGVEFIQYFEKQKAKEDALRVSEAKLAAARSDPTLLQALDEQDQLAAEAKELEAKIAEAGATAVRDWREAERELWDLEQEVGGGGPGAGMVAVGGSFEAAGASAPVKTDPIPPLLSLAQDLFSGASLESLGAAVRERAGQYLMALSERRYNGLQLDGRGQATLVAPGRTVPAGQLDDADLDLLYLSVKLTLLERQAPLGKLTLVLDEPFVGFDDARQQLLSRMLKHIGTLTQVLHATALPAHRGFADHAAPI